MKVDESEEEKKVILARTCMYIMSSNENDNNSLHFVLFSSSRLSINFTTSVNTDCMESLPELKE